MEASPSDNRLLASKHVLKKVTTQGLDVGVIECDSDGKQMSDALHQPFHEQERRYGIHTQVEEPFPRINMLDSRSQNM